MSTNDTTWGDAGFDADDDSFMAGQQQANDVPPAPESSESGSPEPPVRRVELPRSSIPPTPPVPPVKKRRGAMFWVAAIAGLLLVVAIGGSLVWYVTKPDVDEEYLYAPADEPAPATSQQETTPPVDSQVAVVDTPLVVHQESQMEPEPKPKERPAMQEQPHREPKIRETPPPPAPKPPVVKKEEPTPKAPQISTSAPPPTKAKPLYVVQVFSSPSKDDAEEWLQSLRDKKVNDGYITEQQIKGQPWYRVRFGQFERKEDAEAAAMNMGFSQPWVARIR